MRRSIIGITAAALALAGCSGKGKDEQAAKPAATAKDGKGAPHVNPWAKDAPAGEAAPAAAPAAKKPDPKAKPTSNPWAKDPPPGAAASEHKK